MGTMRGTLYNRARAEQQIDYRGLAIGTITPTDVDGLIDYHGRCWIVLEYKTQGAEMPLGQRIALERLTDDLSATRPAICLVAEHHDAPGDDIDGGRSMVVQYRFGGKWRTPERVITVNEAIDTFLRMQE